MGRVQTKVSLRAAVATAWTSLESPPAAPGQSAAHFQRVQKPVLAFGCLVALLVLFAAYFTDRNGDMDELTFYNPSYMIAHFGKWTYPGYAHRTYFDDPVITHPPLHVGLIGLLGRVGFTYYYAEATPTAFFFLLAILVILRGAFPAPVKLGLLFSIGFLMLNGENFGLLFGTRPEGELHAAWFAGLLLLESGRLENWSQPKLFAGAFLLTWASGVHYYAGAAFLGVAVYITWALWSLGWKVGRSRVFALCAGGCLFGIPYAGFYLVPYYKKIWMAVEANQGNRGVLVAVRAHLDWYRAWARSDYFPALIGKPFGLGVPLLVFSTAVLSLIPSTRGLALAALPLQLFIFGIASHKLSTYFIHEVGLFAAAVGVGSLVLAERLWRRVPVAGLQQFFLPVAAALLALYLVTGNPALRAAILSKDPRVHEADLARAASRAILGPHARVAGRLGAWYSSGAAYWWDIESEMLGPMPYDPAKFFANFDAVVEYPHMSGIASRTTISSWYAQGDLKLRGFYFGETNEQLRIVLLSPRPVPQVIGYAARNGQLYRFEEHADGNFQVLSAACPSAPAAYQNWPQRWADTFLSVLWLPTPHSGEPLVMLTVLAHRAAPGPADWIARSCQGVSKVFGSLLPADRKQLVDSLRREDTPIQFYRDLAQMPGYAGVGLPPEMTPPQDGVRLNQVLRFSAIQTPRGVLIAGPPPFTISTGPLLGDFGADIPLAHGELVNTPCWVQLRLRVISGRIAFGTFNARSGVFFHRTGASILTSGQPVDVALTLPDLRGASHVVIFNDGQFPGRVELLDGAIFVSREDWEHSQATLSALR